MSHDDADFSSPAPAAKPATPSPFPLIARALNALDTAELQMLRKLIEQKLKQSFSYGDKVKFTARNGETIEMIVQRINAKTLGGVQTGGTGGRVGMNWRVHPSFCMPV